MSRTLNLVDILLTTGRHLFLVGRFTEALVPLTKLAAFRQLPRHVLEELQALLGEIHLQQKNYKQARRHLTGAISCKPLKAEYHFLMAVAIEEDPDADLKRAEMYYARAVQIEPDQPAYWADFGSYLFAIEKSKKALKAIRKAYALAPTDPEIVGQVAAILRREGYAEEATTKLRAAVFHNHGAAAFHQLWQQHRFQLLHTDQQARKAETVFSAEEPAILPFVPTASQGKYMELGAKTFRIDQAEPLAEPTKKEPVPFRRPPKKG